MAFKDPRGILADITQKNIRDSFISILPRGSIVSSRGRNTFAVIKSNDNAGKFLCIIVNLKKNLINI